MTGRGATVLLVACALLFSSGLVVSGDRIGPKAQRARFVPALPAQAKAQDPLNRQDSLASAPSALRAAARSAIQEDSYRIVGAGESGAASRRGFRAVNHANRFEVAFDPDQLTIRPRRAQSGAASSGGLGLSLKRYGYSGSMVGAGKASISLSEDRVTYDRGNLKEWYLNRADGLEQGFTVLKAPPGRSKNGSADNQSVGPLTLGLSVGSNVTPRLRGQIVDLIPKGRKTPHLTYSGLHSFDANGRKLKSLLSVDANSIQLTVHDEQAKYPITIDPTIGSQQAKLVANDAGSDMELGTSVAISGETAVVGAPNNASAYVFVRSRQSWTFQQKLTGKPNFGSAVAISGDTVMVGAESETTQQLEEGVVHVFERSGADWVEKQALEPSPAVERFQDHFGFSVALEGNAAIIGAVRAGAGNTGSAYVFRRGANGFWAQEQELAMIDEALSGYGYSAAISGDTAVIGSPYYRSATGANGAAYVFVRQGSIWVQQARLTGLRYGFGSSVAISGETLVVGDPYGDVGDSKTSAGSAHVYVRTGVFWPEQQRLTATDATTDAHFGSSVAASGDIVVVGAAGYDDPSRIDAGAGYVFTRSGTAWTQQRRFSAGDAGAGDALGTSVALSGDTVVIGAPMDDLPGFPDAGSAYVFVPGEPPVDALDFAMSLAPATSSGPEGTSFTVTASVTNKDQTAAPGKKVRFSVDGDNFASGEATSNSAGQAPFTYQGRVAGTDSITAFADIDSDGVRQPIEPEAVATRTWVPSGPPPADPPVASGKVRWWGECFPLACPNKPTTPSGLSSAVAVVAGTDYRLALGKDGSILAWGANDYGQLGDGTLQTREEPVQVKDNQGQIFRAKSIAAGGGFSLAVGADDALWSWGNNISGQLGNGTRVSSPVPVRVINPDDLAGPLTKIKAIAAGYGQGLAVSEEGKVWSWGCNSSGQLGRGSADQIPVPPGPVGSGPCGDPIPGRVVGENNAPLANIKSVTAGGEFSLALSTDGQVWAWGTNGFGQLGDGTKTTRLRPVKVTDPRPGDSSRPLESVKAISAGQDLSMVLKTNGTVWGWGDNSQSQLARDPQQFSFTKPVRIGGLPRIVSVAAGNDHGLVSDGDGAVWSWGLTMDGIGSGRAAHITPIKVQNLGGRATALAARWSYSLAIVQPPIGPPKIEVRPGSLDFLDQEVGSSSGPKTLGITNVGIDPLRIDAIKKQGSDSAAFSVESDGCSGTSLRANRACSIGIVFSPGAPGPRRASLSISHSADGSPLLVALSGTGIDKTADIPPPPQFDPGSWWGELDRSFNSCRPGSRGPCDGRVARNVGSPINKEHYGGISDSVLQPDGKIVVAGNGGGEPVVLRYKPNGILDPAFGEAGVVRLPAGASAGLIARRSDGGFIVGGSRSLTRLLPDGRVDATFGANGTSQNSVVANDMAIQPDGKIILVGAQPGPPRQHVAWACPGEDPVHCRSNPLYFLAARYLENGQPDKGFGSDGTITASIGNGDSASASSVALQPDGKIVAAGAAARVGDINASQCVSSAFTTAYFATFFVPLYCRDVKMDFALARFTKDGQLDEKFGDKGALTTQFDQENSAVHAIALQPDGKIVVAGCVKGPYCNYGAPEGGFALARYTPDGSLDKDFGFERSGKVVTNFASQGAAIVLDLAVTPAGDIVAVGSAGKNLAVARYSKQGFLEDDFGEGGKVATPPPCGMSPRHKLCFITSEDLNDSGVINSVLIQPGDGKIVGSGFLYDGGFGSFSGENDYNLMMIRYQAAGTIDTGFGEDGLVTKKFEQFYESAPAAVAVQQDGKIVVAGRANARSGYYEADPALTRYNPDGILDTAFGKAGEVVTNVDTFDSSKTRGEGGGFDDVLVQPDGRILAVGHIETTFEQTRIILARYNPDGTLDAGFHPCDTPGKACQGMIVTGGDATEPLTGKASVALQGNKIVVAAQAIKNFGTVPLYNYSPQGSDFAAVRYDLDGVLDTGFGKDGLASTSIGADAVGTVHDMAVQTDGKIVLAGTTGASLALTRFEKNGALDRNFNGTGKVVGNSKGTTAAYGVALQKAGEGVEKIIVAGPAPTISSNQPAEEFSLSRYNPDGVIDTSFGNTCPPPSSCGGTVATKVGVSSRATGIAIQPDGKIVAAGWGSDHFVASDRGPAFSAQQLALARYSADGSLDECANPGTTTADVESPVFGEDVALQTDGRIVVVGESGSRRKFGIARFMGGDHDPGKELSISAEQSVPEPDSGTVPATFTVSVAAPACHDINVDFVTSDGTAKAGSDYQATSKRVTIPAGKRDAVLEVPVIGDTTPEPNEDFFVDISSPDATVVQPRGRATILDAAPGLSIGDVTVTEGDSGKVQANFDVTLNGGVPKTVTVDYSTADSTARAGSDYVATRGTLKFAPGENHKTISVAVLGDTLDEPNEKFVVNLTKPVNATLARAQGIGTILDDDSPAPADKDPFSPQRELAPIVPGLYRPDPSPGGGNLPTGSLPPPELVTGAQSQSQVQSQAQAQAQVNAQTQSQAQAQSQIQVQPRAQLAPGIMFDRERQVQVERVGPADKNAFMATERQKTPVIAKLLSWMAAMMAFGLALANAKRAQPADSAAQAKGRRRRR